MATESLPKDVTAALDKMNQSLNAVEKTLKPFFEVPLHESRAKLQPLDQAKLELIIAYALNTLFWLYITTQGTDAQEHPVKQELERVKLYMNKVKELAASKDAKVKLNKDAANRFIRNALWDAEESAAAKKRAVEETSTDAATTGATETQQAKKKKKKNARS
eukprot:Colp12_sorted_trinity150504_noHs@19443